MRRSIPKPEDDEQPKCYADRLGRWYASVVPSAHKKASGQYLTPVVVADFMGNLFDPPGRHVRLLDPGAGTGVLACAACEALASRRTGPLQLSVHAYETDAKLLPLLERCLSYTQNYLRSRGVSLSASVAGNDFVVEHAGALDQCQLLFDTRTPREAYDAVICNPPYFKLAKADLRAQMAASVVHGQPNIYALFMAVSAALLVPQGELVFITPRSFASGTYFRLFRKRFLAQMRPEAIHVFNSRRDAFDRDSILQENIILKARREDEWMKRPRHARVSVSISEGAADLRLAKARPVAMDLVVDSTGKERMLRIPASESDGEIMKVVHSWEGSLAAYGFRISTGPVVPFRATHLLCHTGRLSVTHAPLLWMQHVHTMRIEWPIPGFRKAQYLRTTDGASALLVPNKNYVLLRRFSAKEQRRRLTAAPLEAGGLDCPTIALENHLNYLYRPEGGLTQDEAWGLAALYNSTLLDTYFRTLNGTTQVNATDLQAVPLPPLQVITAIGAAVRRRWDRTETEDLDCLVLECVESAAVGNRSAVPNGQRN